MDLQGPSQEPPIRYGTNKQLPTVRCTAGLERVLSSNAEVHAVETAVNVVVRVQETTHHGCQATVLKCARRQKRTSASGYGIEAPAAPNNNAVSGDAEWCGCVVRKMQCNGRDHCRLRTNLHVIAAGSDNVYVACRKPGETTATLAEMHWSPSAWKLQQCNRSPQHHFEMCNRRNVFVPKSRLAEDQRGRDAGYRVQRRTACSCWRTCWTYSGHVRVEKGFK